MIFLDTDVLIEWLRGSSTAQAWLNECASEAFAVPGIVAMELVAGCRDNAELLRLQKFMDSFSVAWPDDADFQLAYHLLIKYRLKAGLGIPDCLIAAMTIRRSARLYSFNLKHFRVIENLDVQQPYQRQ